MFLQSHFKKKGDLLLLIEQVAPSNLQSGNIFCKRLSKRRGERKKYLSFLATLKSRYSSRKLFAIPTVLRTVNKAKTPRLNRKPVILQADVREREVINKLGYRDEAGEPGAELSLWTLPRTSIFAI